MSYLLGFEIFRISFCLKFETSNLLPECLNFLTLFSIILLIFCVWEVDSKHRIFKGLNFGIFRDQNVVDEKFTGIFQGLS